MSEKWNAKIMFPTDNVFINRCLTAKFAPSNSGNPMITLELEVVTPQEYEIGGRQIIVAGVKANVRSVTRSFNDDGTVNEDNTKKCQQRIVELYKAFGLEHDNLDFDNLDVSGFKNKKVMVSMNSNIQEKRKTPTSEQLKKGQQGDVMKNPLTGKAEIQYWPNIVEIYGLAQEQAVGAGY